MSALIIEVCKVEEIIPIEKADKLELIKVKGWQCVVSKGQYKIGDLVIYCPPDSVIPTDIIEKYKLEFLKKNGRVGTIKLRGAISQGLILDIPQPMGHSWIAGLDVAIMMGITKYEPPEPEYGMGKPKEKVSDLWIKYKGKEITFRRFVFKSIGVIKDNYSTLKKKKLNPHFDKYTDIENINNYNNVIKEGEVVIITEKLHGCNARYGNLQISTERLWDKIKYKLFGSNEFVYGSRTVQKRWTNIHKGYYKEDVWGEIARRYKINEWLPKDYLLYGEIIGEGIQKGYSYGLKGTEIYIFDVKYKNEYLNWEDLQKFYNEYLLPHNMKQVPILFVGQYNDDLRKILTKGFSTLIGAEKIIREGVVIRPTVERIEHMGRAILKSINEEYLLIKNNTDFH